MNDRFAVFEATKDEPGKRILLHSRMPAAQRRSATAALHAAVGPEAPAGPVLMVATQVAEAALDLDLDVLATDLAPMASLLQRTGRLWRHSVNLGDGDGWKHPPHLDTPDKRDRGTLGEDAARRTAGSHAGLERGPSPARAARL